MTRMPIFVSDGRGPGGRRIAAGRRRRGAVLTLELHRRHHVRLRRRREAGIHRDRQAASGQATQTDQNGHTVTGTVCGGIDGDVVGITFLGDGDLWHFNAAINADGSAQGVFEYNGGIRTGTWHASAPLACLA